VELALSGRTGYFIDYPAMPRTLYQILHEIVTSRQ
jgi:hypothetical protein